MPPRPTARLLLECLEGRAVPATFTVTTSLDIVDPSDGRLSLREAITRANKHSGADVIDLPPGVYRIALAGAGEDGNLTGDLDITDSTLVRGTGAGATVVDGQRLDRVFDVFGGAPGSIRVALQGLTVRNGSSGAGSGGGVRVGNADLVVRDCAVTGNRATGAGGGGISNAELPGTGDVALVRTLVAHNVADGDGGGVSVLGDGQGRGSVLTVAGSTVRRNLAGNAGGIRASQLNLTASAVTGNATNNNGGGIWADAATLADCTVSGNACDNIGGGILVTTAMLTRCTVAGNFAADVGGGVAGGDLTLANCTVSVNTAGGEGGGISAGTLRLAGSSVAGNSADFGGGVSAVRATMTNSTVSGNSAGDGGGGIRATTASLTNSTVSGNSAALRGGGILAGGVTLLSVTVTDNSAREGGGVFLLAGGTSSVRNTIIADNLVDSVGAGPDVSGAFVSGGHNLIGDGTGGTGFADGANGDIVGTGANPIDPRLGPLANNGGPTKTHALLAGSRAIDRGDGGLLPPTDQRGAGFPRQRDGNGDGVAAADIGAFER